MARPLIVKCLRFCESFGSLHPTACGGRSCEYLGETLVGVACIVWEACSHALFKQATTVGCCLLVLFGSALVGFALAAAPKRGLSLL